MKPTLFFVVIAGLLMTGCKSSSPSEDTTSKAQVPEMRSHVIPKSGPGLVGKWVPDQETIKKRPGVDPNYLIGFCSTFWYDFKGDKSFNSSVSSGHYEMKGNTIEITTTKMGTTDLKADSPQMTGV